jgi:hypothetical protein
VVESRKRDGLLLAIAPDVARSLRFDDVSFPRFDGYDVDFAFEVRRSGRRVVLADLDLHHHTKAVFDDAQHYEISNAQLTKKWGLSIGPVDRARRRATRLRSKWWSFKAKRSAHSARPSDTV